MLLSSRHRLQWSVVRSFKTKAFDKFARKHHIQDA